MIGVELRILYPNYSGRDCKTCLNYLFNEEWGVPERQAGSGRMIRRAPGNLPLCRQIDDEHPYGRCPKGTPEFPLDLTPQNRAALRYHIACKEIGRWPDDERVLRNAAIIANATSEAEARKRWLTEKQIVGGIMLLAQAVPSTPRV